LDFDNLAPFGELSCKLRVPTSMPDDRPGQDKQCLSPTLFSRGHRLGTRAKNPLLTGFATKINQVQSCDLNN